MLQNFVKLAWRNLLKNKTFSLINIAGLAIGLCCFLLIVLYVTDELSYDRHHEKADRIYRIDSDISMGGTDLKLAVCSDPMGPTLKRDYPQVEQYVRIYNSSGSKMIKKGTEFLNEPNVAHADSTLFEVFTLPVLVGDSKNALNEPGTVVITESAAKKYFGSIQVLGKFLETDDSPNRLYKITAVIKDIPDQSHFNFDFIFSMDNVNYDFGNYLSHNFQTYLLLQEGTDPEKFEKNFNQVIDKYVIPQAKQFMNIDMDEFRRSGNRLEYSLFPLKDIHLKSHRSVELGVNGNIQYVYIFSAVALFILLIACFNFMNLSTARSANRRKEVGIRKVLGTRKIALIWQFLTESTLMAFIALLLAMLMARLALPYFNDVSSKSLMIGSLFSSRMLPFLVLLPLIVGVFAGLYPAFFLSSFQPIKVLKGAVDAGVGKSSLRSGLVVFQFTTSIVLIIGTMIVFSQLQYIQNRKVGFNKDQVLVIDGTGALGINAKTFKEEVSGMAGVISSTFSGFLPVENSSRTDNTYSSEAVMNSKNGFNMQTWAIDEGYLETLGMELIMGRSFSKEFRTDSSALIINESAAKLLGYKNPIGKKIYSFLDNNNAETVSYTIIGVVKNFNYESLHHSIAPLCFRLGESSWSTAFRIKAGNAAHLIGNIEAKYKSMAPGMPFRYSFLDESFDLMYRAEQRVGKIAMIFAILTILIAGLGLFGLATFTAEQRIKEIGIRKVLGASVSSIVGLLSKDFLKLVFVANLLAWPFAWWIMNSWLQDFAYRINIGWWMFVIAGVLTVAIAFLTVGFQAFKAAVANPVKSLRTE